MSLLHALGIVYLNTSEVGCLSSVWYAGDFTSEDSLVLKW